MTQDERWNTSGSRFMIKGSWFASTALALFMMISDLVSIAAAGGGLRIDCKDKMISDIVRIVAAAGNNRAIVVLENTEHIMVADKIRIAAAGKGFVFFNDMV